MDVHLEERRYYTPSLEEFHIGFEYEFKHPESEKWVKYVLREVNPEREDCPFSYQGYELNDFRVKYLDAEDMLSLGFTQDKDYKCSFTGKYGNKFFRKDESAGFNNGVFFIITLGGGSMIQLEYEYYSSYSNPSGKIQMIVKNKLELSKLLNQFSN